MKVEIYTPNLNLIYENGELKEGVTRGNGEVGEVVTNNISTIREIPRKLNTKNPPKLIEIRGEVFLNKSDFEKNLFNKINEIKKYYSSINNDENYEKSLSILADARKEVFEFFDNVQVNEDNETLRKNRLELINMLCKTFQNFINFQLLKTINE